MSSQSERQGIEGPAIIKQHPFPVWPLARSPDGKQIASASADKQAHTWQPPVPEGTE